MRTASRDLERGRVSAASHAERVRAGSSWSHNGNGTSSSWIVGARRPVADHLPGPPVDEIRDRRHVPAAGQHRLDQPGTDLALAGDDEISAFLNRLLGERRGVIAAQHDLHARIERLRQANRQLRVERLERRHRRDAEDVGAGEARLVVSEGFARDVAVEHLHPDWQIRYRRGQNRIDGARRLDDFAKSVDRERPGVDERLRVKKENPTGASLRKRHALLQSRVSNRRRKRPSIAEAPRKPGSSPASRSEVIFTAIAPAAAPPPAETGRRSAAGWSGTPRPRRCC